MRDGTGLLIWLSHDFQLSRELRMTMHEHSTAGRGFVSRECGGTAVTAYEG